MTVVVPRAVGALCATAHPAGCAERIRRYAAAARALPPLPAPRTLVVGCSSGLGLAVRAALILRGGATTVGVTHARATGPAGTATAGWYNAAALATTAAGLGVAAPTVVGDCFDARTRAAAVDLVRSRLGRIDLLVFSVAARSGPGPDGRTHRTALKPIGRAFGDKSYDIGADAVRHVTLAAATDAEIASTVHVMGGRPWRLWLEALAEAGLFAPGCATVAFSYEGGDRLAPTYRAGTLGRAKADLAATAAEQNSVLARHGGRADVAVMSAMVTQSSVVIPMSALYTVLLRRVLVERGRYEEPWDQVNRFLGSYFAMSPGERDGCSPRLDDRELDPGVQAEVERRWAAVRSDNLRDLGDVEGFRLELARLNGFGYDGAVDYTIDVDCAVQLPGAVHV